MNLSLSRCPKTTITAAAHKAGAVAVGFAAARPCSRLFIDSYRRWIEHGNNATMEYLRQHDSIRFDPGALLPGAKTVISLAFPYAPPGGYHHPQIADYALGQDYHIVLRRRLSDTIGILASLGAQSRICVDSAPIPERYWAVMAGIGFTGLNRHLIVPGVGAGVFLAEIITTLEIEPDKPCSDSCGECGKCIAACPTGALSAGGFDARKCLSYLTTEHRGDLPDGVSLHGRLVGCDTCRLVCPHQPLEPPEPLPEFLPDPRLLKFDTLTIFNISTSQYNKLIKNSALSRISAKQMKRNSEINKN